jgi:cellular nucleic acid-binding protein
MNTNIYVLKLSNNKWYIGKSEDPLKRYHDHLNGAGSAWTKLYKPISLEKIIKGSVFDEEKITKEYMEKYGIENVRGGSYVQIELSEFHKEALKMEIWGAKDLCFQCGRSGHFVKDCYATKDVTGRKIEYEEEEEWGCDYCQRTFTTQFGCMIHEKSCKDKMLETVTLKKGGTCYRCGRPGHYSPDCYASRHIRGYDL